MASTKSLQKIKELNEKRHLEPGAKREWDKLVKAYDRENFTQTPHHPKGAELKELIENLAEALDHREIMIHKETDDCCGRGNGGDGRDGGDGADELPEGIDLDNLAELVFERLIFEVRIERERVGRSA